MMNEPRKRCFEWLCEICAARGVIPTSCVLSPGSLLQSELPGSSGGFKGVWKGKLNETSVAMKRLRVGFGQLGNSEQVRWLSIALDDNS